MAEIEKSGLEAKLARVSKRRIYSRARELSQAAADSSSESDSDSESEEEEEMETFLNDLHSAKVLVNAAQPDSEKLIKREVMKMACMDDLLTDYISSEDSSASSTDSSSGESSDSDDSSDSDLSSADESDDEEEEVEKKTVKGRQTSGTPREGLDKGLPEIEYLNITLPSSVQLTKVGCVSSIIGSLVIVQGERDTPALNMETVLFKSDRTVLGQVFELFGPVISPFYSVRFNKVADIEEHGIKLRTEAFFAPQNVDVTQYVFTEQLKKIRGTDASWKNDEEVPGEFQDFSDDEAESQLKNKKKKDRKRKVPQGNAENGQNNWRQGQRQEQFHGRGRQYPARSHPPLQRQQAGRPPPFMPRHGPPPSQMYGPPPPRNQFMPSPQNMRGYPPSNNMAPPPPQGFHNRFGYHEGSSPQQLSGNSSSGQFQRHSLPPNQWGPNPWGAGGPPRPGFPPGNVPMFQNPQAMGPPPHPSTQGTPLQPRQQHGKGFSARDSSNPAGWKQTLPQSGKSFDVPHMFSARDTGAAPPWQQKKPAHLAPHWSNPLPPPPTNPPPNNSVASSSDQATLRSTMPLMNSRPPPPLSFQGMPFVGAPPPPPGMFPWRGPPPSGGDGGAGDTQAPPPLMGNQQVHTAASTSISAPLDTGQSKRQGPGGNNSRFGASRDAARPPSSSFAPPPVPPPSFHPRMMQSFRGPNSQSGT